VRRSGRVRYVDDPIMGVYDGASLAGNDSSDASVTSRSSRSAGDIVCRFQARQAP
jgi:hypothetical protein